MAGPGFCWEQNNLGFLGNQAIKAGERLCIQDTVLLEIIIPGPGSLLDRTEWFLCQLCKEIVGSKARELRLVLLSFPIYYISGKGAHVGVSSQTGKAAIGEPPSPPTLCELARSWFDINPQAGQ